MLAKMKSITDRENQVREFVPHFDNTTENLDFR